MNWGGVYTPIFGNTQIKVQHHRFFPVFFFRSQLKEAIYEGHLHATLMNNLPPRALETNRNSSNC